jgi:hypothetical protein
MLAEIWVAKYTPENYMRIQGDDDETKEDWKSKENGLNGKIGLDYEDHKDKDKDKKDDWDSAVSEELDDKTVALMFFLW